MLRKAVFLCLILFFVSSCSTFRSEEKNFMWKVSDGDSNVYLLGSIHLGKPEFYPLDSLIEDAFEQADYLVVELNPDNINPMEVIMKGTYSDDGSLREALSEDSYNKISQLFEEFNVPESSYSIFKPWLSIMTIMQLQLNAAGYKADSGIDRYFIQKAQTSDKEILELESFEEQINVLSAFDDLADEYFEYSLKEMNNSVKYVDKMYSYWQKGDTTGIAKILKSGLDTDGFDEINEKLLIERNYRMADKIKEYLRENKNCFIVFGAGHFTGSTGVLNLLEKTGKFSIEQM